MCETESLNEHGPEPVVSIYESVDILHIRNGGKHTMIPGWTDDTKAEGTTSVSHGIVSWYC